MTRFGRAGVSAAAVAMAVAVGCGTGESGSPETLPPISSYRETSTVPTGTGGSTSVAASLDVPESLIEDCLQYVELGAFVGIPEQVTAWYKAGQNETTQRATCRQLGIDDPNALAALSTKLHDLQTFLATATTTTTIRRRKPVATTTTAPAEQPAPPAATDPPAPPPTTPPPETTSPPPPPGT